MNFIHTALTSFLATKTKPLLVTLSLRVHLQVYRLVRRDIRPASLGELGHQVHVTGKTAVKVVREDLRGTGSADESRIGADSRADPKLESSAAEVTVTAADAVGIAGCMSFVEKELGKDNLKKRRTRLGDL